MLRSIIERRSAPTSALPSVRRRRRAQRIEFRAQKCGVEWQWIHRAAAGLGPGKFGIVIRVTGHRAVTHARFLFDITNNLPRVLEVSVEARLADNSTRRGFEI